MAVVRVVMAFLLGGCSDEFDVVNVESDRGQVEVDGVVGVAAKDPAARGDPEAVEGLVAAGVVADQGAAVYFDDVVHASLQPFGIEVEHLVGVVGGDRSSEPHLQPPPGLAGLGPGFDLAGRHTRVGEQEWGGEVVPAGVAEEIAQVWRVPGAIAQHALESRARGVEFIDRLAVQGFHGDGVGGRVEHHPLVGSGERGEHDVFFDGVDREDLVERLFRRPALHRPDRAADRDVDL
jgi:hypothetical protein